MSILNYVLGFVLIWFTWWLWKTFDDIKKRGTNPDPKGKL